MDMRKTFQYRIFPTNSQRTLLQGNLDACRWVYNKTLEVRKSSWEERKESLSRYDTNKLLTTWRDEHKLLANGHAQAMQEAQKRVDLAFRAFFRRVKAGEKPGYPRFRAYDRYDSFTFPQEKSNWRFLENGKVRLSKIGDVKIKVHRPIEGECKTLTIRRDAAGNWYACFSCIVDPKPLPPTDKVVGVDVGLRHFATLSNGEQIDNPRFFRKDEKALATVQRRLSIEPLSFLSPRPDAAAGSASDDSISKEAKSAPQYRKRKRAINHIHQRIANRRKNFAHQESHKLINEYQLIAFENLDIADIQDGNHRGMNKSIADVAWNQFVQFTMHKAEWAGRSVVLVDPRNTTKACSGCGEIVPKTLSQLVHTCPQCGLVLDRDHNAALNILARGLAGMGSIPRSSPFHGGE
jgi:putative transposase